MTHSPHNSQKIAVQVNLFATFRLHAGVKKLPVELLEPADLEQAIAATVELLPVLKPHWLNQSGELHAHVHVFLNGDDAATLPDGLRSRLKNGDVIDFFPPVAGGN